MFTHSEWSEELERIYKRHEKEIARRALKEANRRVRLMSEANKKKAASIYGKIPTFIGALASALKFFYYAKKVREEFNLSGVSKDQLPAPAPFSVHSLMTPSYVASLDSDALNTFEQFVENAMRLNNPDASEEQIRAAIERLGEDINLPPEIDPKPIVDELETASSQFSEILKDSAEKVLEKSKDSAEKILDMMAEIVADAIKRLVAGG